jgi:hypothetical protein
MRALGSGVANAPGTNGAPQNGQVATLSVTCRRHALHGQSFAIG